MQDVSSLQGQELGGEEAFWEGTFRDMDAQGCPSAPQQLCLCHQGLLPRQLKGCISLSLGFEKEISKQMLEKDGPGIYPVSAPCCPLPHCRRAQRGCASVALGWLCQH